MHAGSLKTTNCTSICNNGQYLAFLINIDAIIVQIWKKKRINYFDLIYKKRCLTVTQLLSNGWSLMQSEYGNNAECLQFVPSSPKVAYCPVSL